ncbi:MAG: DNA mismatch endonuclease Vsr [Chitinivibrionales bacterium]|nr:DNA mismatch endonuclease Vsr [Chitinivibrionales bacterium]
MERALRKKLPEGGFVGTKPAHRRIMKGVRGKGNRTTESRMRGALAKAGMKGWSMNVAVLPGKPDFYFSSRRIAVFVDGCFWHGCPRCGHIPQTNSAFWREKIERNRKRDRTAASKLRGMGIRVLRFWEHQIRDDLPRCVEDIRVELKSSR